MEIVKLGDICRPKQWKTIPMSKLKEEGYSVYGANGVIGYYDEYTHENPTVLITCRGATCGTINISEPKSYINGNAMALDNLSSDCDLYYLAYYLKERGFHDVISGSAQPQITREGLKKVEIPLPSLSVQQAIAAQLDQASKLVQYHHQLLEKYDELQQSLFLEMFGDPVLNEKGWERKSLKKVCNKIGSGSTPRGGKSSYKTEGISLIRSMNVYDNEFLYTDLAFIDDEQASRLNNVIVEENDVLFNITGASVCRSTIVPNNVLPARVNQHVSIIRAKKEMLNSIFLNRLLISEAVKRSLLKIGSGGGAVMQAITKLQLEQFEIILPPLSLQSEFASYIESIEYQKSLVREALQQSEDVFNGLLQESFG